MKNLLLTLGHNSSAILIEDNKIVWGYETERVTGVKSDSRFPKPVLDHVGNVKPDMVYVTHWAPDGNLSSMSAKHWDASIFDNIPVRTLTFDRTHHDTHIAAAMCYAGADFCNQPNVYGVVVDGFGTLGEHLSVYKIVDGKPHLVRRVHGYETSLGLWYQYATAFMGMKMHEDEYKLLGYETRVNEDDACRLTMDAAVQAGVMLDKMNRSVYGSKFDPAYNISALSAVKDEIFSHLTRVCRDYNIQDPFKPEARAILAFYVQSVLEHVMLTITGELPAEHLLLSGGVFYNVKLNKRLIDSTTGQICVYPLAGDQGNAIGLYAMDHPEFQFPADLNWGVRSLRSVGHVPGLYVMDEDDAKEFVVSTIKRQGYVNLVRGNMEFGPRAMCNTSTIARPLKDIVHRINTANERNTVMPMAPVMTRRMYYDLFKDTQHVWKSEHHMIVAMEYREEPDHYLRGVAHEYTWPEHHFTGRPQVVQYTDNFMTDVLITFNHPLINTSFNFHGKPIAMGMESIVDNHMMQYRRDNSFTTVVIKND